MAKRTDPTNKISRKKFLRDAALLCAGGAAGAPALLAEAGSAASRDPVIASGETFRLEITQGEGMRVRITDVRTSFPIADGEYSYSFGNFKFSDVVGRPLEGGSFSVSARSPQGIGLVHEFVVPPSEPWVEEWITLTNRSQNTLHIPDARCGFVLPLTLAGGEVEGALKDFKFTAVPFRREPHGNRKQYADYTLAQVLTEPRKSILRSEITEFHWGEVVAPKVFESGWVETQSWQYASEGWILTDGKRGYLITKYSPNDMEWAVLDRVPLGGNQMGLRWGGFAIHQGDPEPGVSIEPGKSHTFGATRITAFDGGVTEGFYAFRHEMESRGHGCPQDFNPPAHWNELYDNKLYWVGMPEMDLPENRQKYYTLTDMKEEAAKAQAIGCEALYLDPGWDTRFASKIWDSSRLGPIEEFVATLKRDYNLSLSLHTPLSGWCNPKAYPRAMDRMNRDGTRAELSLCGVSQQYMEETLRRFEALASGGARFFMFDGTMFNGECWDPAHGHRVPTRRHEHVEATCRLAMMIHSKFPDVLIEMHDPLLGGTHLRYVPLYYGHGEPVPEEPLRGRGFDTVWAFELMWDPMTDLVGGHSIALYYYNLAYSLPLYIHIDLRKDNENALMLWWNISTCRHLGIGGTHTDAKVREAHKRGMADYRRLKPFFAAGTFWGIDELTHLHRHPRDKSAVINCFNLEDRSVTRTVSIDLARFGLDPAREYSVTGNSRRRVGAYDVEVTIAAYGHALIEMAPK